MGEWLYIVQERMEPLGYLFLVFYVDVKLKSFRFVGLHTMVRNGCIVIKQIHRFLSRDLRANKLGL